MTTIQIPASMTASDAAERARRALKAIQGETVYHKPKPGEIEATVYCAERPVTMRIRIVSSGEDIALQVETKSAVFPNYSESVAFDRFVEAFYRIDDPSFKPKTSTASDGVMQFGAAMVMIVPLIAAAIYVWSIYHK